MPATDMFGKPWPTGPGSTQDELQRTLSGGTSNTMPVGGGSSVRAVTPRGSAPSGFDQKNWDDPGMQSVKYRAGRLLAGATKPSEIAARVGSQEFQDTFKGATFDGKDRVNFNGALSDGASGVPVYDIDVLMGADKDADTSNGFWWGHDVPGMNQGPATASPIPSATVASALPGQQQSDLMAQIIAALQAQQEPDPQALLQQALR